MFIQRVITNGYVLPFLSKPNLVRFPLIQSEYKARQKDQAQNGNSRVHQDLPDSRGMGIVNRPIRRLPSHSHPSKLKEIPKVLLQVAGVPVHLPPIRTSHSPPGLYNDCKRSEANGPLQRTQTSPIPGQLADQVPVSGGSPSEHSGSGRPNPVLGLDNKSGKIRTETYSGVFVRGLRIPSRFGPCKTHSREMAQTPKARHIPGCLNVIANLLSRLNQVQSTEWSLHPQVFKQICLKWFTPHVDLFATHLNHKLPLYVSPVPDPNAWDIGALNLNWTGLTAYSYPPTALLHRVIQKIRQCHGLIIVIVPDWPVMPWFWDLVQLSTEIPLQLPVSTKLLKQSHNYVFHSNPQHLNLHAWCLGVDSSKNKASLWRWQRELLPLRRHQQGQSTSQSGPYLRNGAEKIRWISPLHL